jgi:hypothetical protein
MAELDLTKSMSIKTILSIMTIHDLTLEDIESQLGPARVSRILGITWDDAEEYCERAMSDEWDDDHDGPFEQRVVGAAVGIYYADIDNTSGDHADDDLIESPDDVRHEAVHFFDTNTNPKYKIDLFKTADALAYLKKNSDLFCPVMIAVSPITRAEMYNMIGLTIDQMRESGQWTFDVK